jgi:hypothetical protein
VLDTACAASRRLPGATAGTTVGAMRRPVVRALLGLVLLAGCSSGDGGADASPGTATITHTTTAAPSATGSAAGCPSSGDGVPAGAEQAPTVDVDGDGRPDTEWIAQQPGSDGGVTFGVTTASGGTATAVIRSASPVARSVLVADVTGRGEVVALASDGRQVLLYAVRGCGLVPVLNEQGQQYAFDLGFTGFGTGVGCADVDGDGVTDLLGLLLQPPGAQNAEAVVQQTIVVLDGAVARNGATTASPAGDEARQEAAQSVTCGDRTLDTDGVTSAP